MSPISSSVYWEMESSSLIILLGGFKKKMLTSGTGTWWHRLAFPCSSPLSTTKSSGNYSTDNNEKTMRTRKREADWPRTSGLEEGQHGEFPGFLCISRIPWTGHLKAYNLELPHPLLLMAKGWGRQSPTETYYGFPTLTP